MPAQPNQSLANGIACLQALTAAEEAIGSRELARRLGIEHTLANRLLGTLAELGMAQRTPERKYRPGPGVHVLAAQSLRGSGLLQAALPVIRELLGEGLAVALGVLWRSDVCYLFHGRPGQPLEQGLAGHELFPAEQSSIGLILLAHGGRLPDNDRGRKKPAAAVLRRIRRQGWALSEDNRSLAVAVGSPAIAGLAAITGHTLEAAPQLAERLHVAAAQIAAAL